MQEFKGSKINGRREKSITLEIKTNIYKFLDNTAT